MQREFNRYLMVGIGSLIAGCGINAFWLPHHLYSGGVSGVAMILYFLTGWPIGAMIMVMNVPIFYAAYRLLDKRYLLCAVYGLVVFAVAIDATRFLADLAIVDDILLASVYGGVVAGIGSGMIFRVDGSSGGTDIIAAIVKKYYAFNVGLVSLSINAVLMVAASVLFGPKLALYTLLSMFVSANVTDKVIEGFNRKKTVIIISESCNEIAAAILSEIGRGVTFLEGEGAFTRQQKRVIFVVVTLTQIAQIKFLVERIDPNAFMIVQDAAEVLGKGFSH